MRLNHRAEEYRTKADNCFKSAEEMKDEKTRREMEEIALKWIRMAEEVESRIQYKTGP